MSMAGVTKDANSSLNRDRWFRYLLPAIVGMVLLFASFAMNWRQPTVLGVGLLSVAVYILWISDNVRCVNLEWRVFKLEGAVMRLENVLEARQRDLEYYCQTLMPGTAELASSLHKLARFKDNLGMSRDAEPLYREALALWEATLGAESEAVAGCLTNLGMLCDDLDRFEDGEPLLHRALAIRRKLFGELHPETIMSVAALATHYRRRGQQDVAERYREEWQELRDRSGRDTSALWNP